MNREKDKICSHLLTLSVYIELFQSRDQRLCKFNGTIALVWDTNMADVTSCENALNCVELHPSTVLIDPVSGITL